MERKKTFRLVLVSQYKVIFKLLLHFLQFLSCFVYTRIVVKNLPKNLNCSRKIWVFNGSFMCSFHFVSFYSLLFDNRFMNSETVNSSSVCKLSISQVSCIVSYPGTKHNCLARHESGPLGVKYSALTIKPLVPSYYARYYAIR